LAIAILFFFVILILVLIAILVVILVLILIVMIYIIIRSAACRSLGQQCAGAVGVRARHGDGDVRQDTPDQTSTGNGDGPAGSVTRENISLEQRWQRRSRQCHSGTDRPKHVTRLCAVGHDYVESTAREGSSDFEGCTNGATRRIFVHWHEPARQRARELAQTPAYDWSKRERNKIEALFSELKLRVGLRRLRLRRLWNVSEQFYLAATAQNLKRLVRFLSQQKSVPIPCST
jgi:Transposase DDE domain